MGKSPKIPEKFILQCCISFNVKYCVVSLYFCLFCRIVVKCSHLFSYLLENVL